MRNIKFYNIKKVLRWEFIKSVKSPTFLILTFIIPAIMLIFGGIGYYSGKSGTEKPCKVVVLDETGHFYPFFEKHIKNPLLTIVPHELGTSHEMESILNENKYNGYIIITEENINSGYISFYSLDARNANVDILSGELKTIFSMYKLKNLGLNQEQINTVTTPLRIDVRSIKGDELSFADYILPLVASMILVFAVIFSGQVLMQGIIKEKQNKIVEILLSSISSSELLIGKIIGYGLLSLVQLIIWVFTAIFIVGRFVDLRTLDIGINDLIFPFLYFFFGYFMLSSIFAAIGATMKEAQEGSQVQGLIIMIPMLPIMLSAPIIMNPNGVWVRIISHIPPFIPTMMLLRMGCTNIESWELLTTIIMLILSTLLFVSLGARIFERGIMKYSRAFTFKD